MQEGGSLPAWSLAAPALPSPVPAASATSPGLPACATAALGQSSGKVHISQHFFFPSLPSPFPALHSGFVEMFTALSLLTEQNFLGFAGWMERGWWCKIINPGCDLELWLSRFQPGVSGESAGTAQGCVIGTAPLSLLPELDFPLSGALLQLLSIFLLLTGTEAILPAQSRVYTRKLGSLYSVGSEKGFVWVLVLYPSFVFSSISSSDPRSLPACPVPLSSSELPLFSPATPAL